MTTRNVTSKGGPADPDVSAIVRAAGIKPAPQTKTVADLKPGDWLAADEMRNPAEVLQVHPYRDSEGTATVFVTYLEVGELGPHGEHWYAETEVPLATADDVDQIKQQARRLRVAMQLRQLADLIVRHELPLPNLFHEDVDVMMRYKSPADVEAIAKALGVPVTSGYGQTQAHWPAGTAGDGQVRANWYAYTPREDKAKEYVARDTDEEQTGEAVPVDVQGVPLGGDRPVSAPPAS